MATPMYVLVLFLYVMANLWPFWMPIIFPSCRSRWGYLYGVAASVGILAAVLVLLYSMPFVIFSSCESWETEGRCGVALSMYKFLANEGFGHASLLSFIVATLFFSHKNHKAKILS